MLSPPLAHAHIVRMSEQVAALTVDDAVGHCGRTLAFVALMRSESGFRRVYGGVVADLGSYPKRTLLLGAAFTKNWGGSHGRTPSRTLPSGRSGERSPSTCGALSHRRVATWE